MELPKLALVIKIFDSFDLYGSFLDQFFCTSTLNSDGDRVCPHDGHLLLYGRITSFIDFSIRIFAILAPHLPQTTSTDISSYVSSNIIKEIF
jgi:hypothetical protein